MSHAGVLTAAELNRATLARQLLLRPSTLTIPAALEHLVGLQAQAPWPPYTGLWTRLARFDPHELGALLTERAVVRVALQRSTIHLVTAADCLAMRPALQPMLDQQLRHVFGKQLTGLDFAALADYGANLLADTTPTTTELGKLLAARWPDYQPSALANALRNTLTLVQVPPRAVWGKTGTTRVTTAQTWLGRPLGRDASPAPLLRRYLAAFGPATVQDMQRWCGLTGLRAVVDDMRADLVRLTGPDGAELFDLPDAPRPDGDTAAPVRLLPQYDNLLLSYADGARIIDPAHRPALMSANGIIPGTVLVDGTVAALWTLRQTRTDAVTEITPLRRLTRRETDAVTTETARMLAFAAAGCAHHDIRFAQL